MIIDKVNASLARMAASAWYWYGLLLLAVAMEGVALLYQYLWDFAPCVLCIHVRIWLLGAIALAPLAVVLQRYRLGMVACHATLALLMAGLLERSYQLLATERGWIFGSCSMDAGLPDWFALDRWFPVVFQVQEACGYTPELLFGITMAEALLIFSAVMCLCAVVMVLVSLFRPVVIET